MPDIQWNFQKWNDEFDWEQEKPGWCFESAKNDADWRGNLYPRIASFLPARRILEIAPGHGRWTHYLANYCDELVIVDLAPNCIAACKQRFANLNHISYHINDGMSLDFLPAESIDFAFSFDSLVHVDVEVIDSYVSHLSRALTANGVGFFHHSNSAALPRVQQATEKVKIRGGRSTSVSAAIFEQICQQFNLCCIVQEIITWNSEEPIDCLSVFCRRGSKWERPNTVFETFDFPKTRSLNTNIILRYVI